jgi:hypothetical protein
MTAMRLLTGAEYIAWTDFYSSAIKALLTAIGDEDTAASAIGYACEVRDAITELDEAEDFDVTIDLLPAAGQVITALALESALQSRFSGWNSAVRNHVNEDLGTWLTAEAAGRVSHYWKRSGDTSIPAVNCFPPLTVLRTVAVTGSGTSTQVAGSAVDSTKYGGGQVALRALNQSIGAASIVATLTGVDAGGSARTWTCTIPNGTAQDAVTNAAGTGCTTAVSVSAITFTGGTNGDDFDCIVIEDRTIT